LAREYEKKDLEPANKDFRDANSPRQKKIGMFGFLRRNTY